MAPEWFENLTLSLGGLIIVVRHVLIGRCVQKVELWRGRHSSCQRSLEQKEELLAAQVLLTDAALRLRDAERVLKLHYQSSVDALTSLLDKAIRLPLYADYAGTGTAVDVWNFPPLADVVREAGDDEYLALPFEAWSVMLTGIYDVVEAAMGEWKADIHDCENFALDMVHFVSFVCRDSGFPIQAAFSYARSPSHGYNVFIDSGGEAWVFEPQSGKVIGKLGETEKPYDTIRVYFLS